MKRACSGSEAFRAAGEGLIADGKVGCLVVAGGQGTRLGFEGPKGLFSINGVTLFERIARKTRGSLAIMTSPKNDAATREFDFGVEVDFFQQEMLPLLDDKGNEGVLAPSGNGGALRRFVETGLWQKWWDQGVRILSLILVDNVLSDPFDAELVGFLGESEIVIKGVERSAGESMGVITEGGLVVEYSELEEDTGGLGNVGHFCMKMEFAKRKERLPLHRARKQGMWKQEEFIFDILPFAKDMGVLVCPREACFLPLKRPEDLPAIQQADIF